MKDLKIELDLEKKKMIEEKHFENLRREANANKRDI